MFGVWKYDGCLLFSVFRISSLWGVHFLLSLDLMKCFIATVSLFYQNWLLCKSNHLLLVPGPVVLLNRWPLAWLAVVVIIGASVYLDVLIIYIMYAYLQIVCKKTYCCSWQLKMCWYLFICTRFSDLFSFLKFDLLPKVEDMQQQLECNESNLESLPRIPLQSPLIWDIFGISPKSWKLKTEISNNKKTTPRSVMFKPTGCKPTCIFASFLLR